MLELFRRSKTHKENLSEKRSKLKRSFLANKENQWILKDRYLLESFKSFFDRLNENQVTRLLKERPIAFIKAQGKYACALSAQKDFHIIMIFPEIEKMLKSPLPEEGLAILAHEVGHIFYQHSYREIDPLEAQIEADSFACDMGLTLPLESFLQKYEHTIEGKVRISRITCRHFNEGL